MFPTDNLLGLVFPTETPARMATALGIRAGERVLDIGGGGVPLPEASVILEYDLSSGHDRDYLPSPVDNRWVVGDAQRLPFPDKSFDFAYCSHVLEHVVDPIRACKEIMRVASRGYIETPRKMTELCYGHPTHRWLVDIEDNGLVFERRWFVENPLQNMVLAHVLNYPGAYQRFLIEYRNLTCVQFPWEGTFKCRIIEPSGSRVLFDYDNSEHAGWSHYFFSLNLLANGAPPEFVNHHIERALQLLPEEGIFCALDGAVKLLLGKPEEGRRQFEAAYQLGCDDECLNDNIKRYDETNGMTGGAYLPMNRGWVTQKTLTASTQELIRQLHDSLAEKDLLLAALMNSRSWRVTKPLRAALRILKTMRG